MTAQDRAEVRSPMPGAERIRLAVAVVTAGMLALLVMGAAVEALPSAAPAAPTGLRVLRTTNETIVIGWTDNATNESRYEVGFRRAGAGSWTKRRLRPDRERWVHRGLSPGMAHRYRVRACRATLCSAWAGPVGGRTRASPVVGGCPVFPANNPWNTDVSRLPVHPRSDRYIASINAGARFLHADFGENQDYGIPYVVVPVDQPKVPIRFVEYGEESDPGPYPIPPDAPVEAGSDRHVLVLQRGVCRLFELYHAEYTGPGWDTGSGAIFDLRSNRLRPDGWTSADAAGLPILPGLVRYDEVTAGQINHALRFTVWRTQRGYIHPATHFASSSNDPDLPPMGLRLRLKADYDLSPFRGQALVILRALKKYGMIVADNGSSWFISGATDPRWDDEDLDQLKTVPGDAFEVVYTGPIRR